MTPIPDRALFDFLEHTADAAFTVTDAGEICSWNASAEALFGFGPGGVIGKTCFELFQGRGVLGTLVCTVADLQTLGLRLGDRVDFTFYWTEVGRWGRGRFHGLR